MALERRAYTRPSWQYGHTVRYAATSRRAVAAGVEASGVSPGGAAVSADLGGSSKYSNENFEGRSGEGFHVNSSWTRVSRS